MVLATALFTRESVPTPPAGVRCYTNTLRVIVSPGAHGWPGKGFQVCQFVKLRSGEIDAPLLRIVRPNYRGFMGGVRYDPQWENTFAYMGDRQALLDLPVANEIDFHFVLVRRLLSGDDNSANPWRIWEFGPDLAGKELAMPPFETMALLSDPNLGDLLEKDRLASVFVSQLDR